MKTFFYHFRFRPTSAAIGLAVTLGVARFVFPAASAPVTSTANPKLTVYQGVVTVAPGAGGDSILELGNAGRDIAGTGDIFIRPGSISGSTANFARFYSAASKAYLDVPGVATAGYMAIAPGDAVNEGGEFALLPSTVGSPYWFMDLFQDRFRIHSSADEKFTIDQTGNVYVAGGSLCFGGVGSTDCRNTWVGFGGGPTPSLHEVLQTGNFSAKSASLGTTTSPSATLLVHNAQNGAIVDQPVLSPITGFDGDGLAAFANSNNSAIFAQQNNSGSGSYAGYFSARNATGSSGATVARAGRVFNAGIGDSGNSEGVGFVAQHQFRFTSGPQANLSWSRAAVFQGDLQVYSRNQTIVFPTQPGNYIGNVMSIFANTAPSSDPNVTGYPLHVENLNPNGFAARFGGAGQINASPASCTGACAFPRAALDVVNTSTGGAGVSTTGILVTAGSGGVGLDSNGGLYSIRATSNGPGTFAGYFIGTTLFEGAGGSPLNVRIKRPDFGAITARELDPITWAQIEKSQNTSCTLMCGSSFGGGKCVAAWRHITGGGSVDGTVPPYGDRSLSVGCTFSSGGLTTFGAPAPGNNQAYEVLRCLCK